MLRIGLVGAGAIARLHLATFSHLHGAGLVGVADSALERADELASLAGVPAHADAQAMIGRVDAVWICTPPFLHAEQTVAFAEAGVHVFSEKPIAVDLASADRMIESCHRAGVYLMVGHVIRYFPETLAIRQMLDRGEIGDPVHVFGRRLTAATLSALPAWAREARLSGGFAVESGVHEVDTVRFLGGEATSVYAQVAYADPEYPDFDTDFRALLRLRDGAGAEIVESRYSALREWSWGVVGTRATALSTRRGELRVARLGEEERILPVAPVTDPTSGLNHPMLAENQAFVDAIRADRPPPITGEEGRRNLEVVLAAHRSSREGRVIPL